jgi:hypothetical protein
MIILRRDNSMKRKELVYGISIFAVILLTLTSLSNVVGYQSVQSSNQNIINERINQRELLFQTICDITNNKEIQRITLKSQMRSGIFPPSVIPVITKTQIRQIYFIGLILSKFISKSRMESVIKKYQFNNQEMQKEINGVIEKDATLKGELTQLSNLKCDCENENTTVWHPVVICTALFILSLFFLWLWSIGIHIAMDIAEIPINIAIDIECTWTQITPPPTLLNNIFIKIQILD